MRRPLFYLTIAMALTSAVASSRDYHVSVNGNDANPGSPAEPYRTISFAARQAQPGDVVVVHEGVYRERVTPPRGGTSDARRIVYRAAEGETVEIKGSEVIKGWKEFKGDVWKVTIPNTFFGDYNPYQDIIAGDWFDDHGRIHHTGEVYLNGKSFYESATLEGVIDPRGSIYTWYCETDDTSTYIYANFQGRDPNKEMVEINVRDSCFYPDKPGVNYLTVRGFRMSQAATQWAPPTAEQIGLIGTHWSKGWIIENNVISDSKCTGITLGKDRKSGQNVWSKDPWKGGATHYNEVIFRALNDGWSKENIGSHIVRNNTIFNCEQAGIVGSLGAIFSRVTNNHIYNIWTKRQFSGAEIAGIKFHAPIDSLIEGNRIHNAGRGIWLDWMVQGTRVTRNLCYDNSLEDLFTEVSHGPYLVDNNLFLSGKSLRNWSEGGAFVHNLMNGAIEAFEVFTRFTPYHEPHSTKVAGLRNVQGGEVRFYNDIFARGYPELPESAVEGKGRSRRVAYGLRAYDQLGFLMRLAGNVYFNGARPYKMEPDYLMQRDFDPMIKVEDDGESVYLEMTVSRSLKKLDTALVTTEFLGKTKVSRLRFEIPDGSALRVDTDYFGQQRDAGNPTAGPFEDPGDGRVKLKVW